MVYLLTYIGGPRDGEECASPRPYTATVDRNRDLYAHADHYRTTPPRLEWVDDTTRRIRLTYRGKGDIDD